MVLFTWPIDINNVHSTGLIFFLNYILQIITQYLYIKYAIEDYSF